MHSAVKTSFTGNIIFFKKLHSWSAVFSLLINLIFFCFKWCYAKINIIHKINQYYWQIYINITYLDTKEANIQVETLDIYGISFSDKNPEQAKFIENQKTVKAETDRISQEEKKAPLIESDTLKEVPAEELQKFLEEQKSKKK